MGIIQGIFSKLIKYLTTKNSDSFSDVLLVWHLLYFWAATLVGVGLLEKLQNYHHSFTSWIYTRRLLILKRLIKNKNFKIFSRLVNVRFGSDFERERIREEMDALDSVVDPLRDFAKDSVRLVKRCHKPDRKGIFPSFLFSFFFQKLN